MKRLKLIFIEFILIFFLFSCSDTDKKLTENYCMEQSENILKEAVQEVSLDNDDLKKADGKDQLECNYIGNINTKKLHYPNCVSVYTMHDKNKIYLYCSIDEALERGYIPCNNCNP